MQSLERKIINPPEALEYARVWGRERFMQKYKIKDYVSASHYLEEKTGDPNFGLIPKLGGNCHKDMLEDFFLIIEERLDYWKSKCEKMEASLKEKDLIIEYLRTQKIMRIEPQIQRILTKCQE